MTQLPDNIYLFLRIWSSSQKVAGSIPDVTGIFHLHNPSGRTMVLGSTLPLNRNEYQEYFLGLKAASAKGSPYDLHVAIV
jgi:hypothetical protein